MESSAFKVLNVVQQLNDELSKLDLNKLNVIPGVQQGLDVPGFAKGGVVGLHPGKPRGTDTIPAWLTPRERVLSVEENRWYERMVMSPIKQAPRYYSQGGAVSNTTVGAINLNVSNLSKQINPEQAARHMHRLIKRRGIR
jgi:hypothetical protein